MQKKLKQKFIRGNAEREINLQAKKNNKKNAFVKVENWKAKTQKKRICEPTLTKESSKLKTTHHIKMQLIY